VEIPVQKGQIKQVGNCWLLRYYEPVNENGHRVMRQKTTKLKLDLTKAISQKEQEKAARAAAELILAPINAGTADPQSRQGLATFLEHVYLPHVKGKKRPSTYTSYFGMWRLLKDHLNGLELREVRTSDVEDLMASATNDKQRAHTTHRNLRNFLRGAFRYAISREMVSRNPVVEAVIPRGLPSRPKPAYTLEEIKTMIAMLPEPARTVVVVAGFTGLRLAEIKGLRWEDFRGNELDIERSVWSGVISETKTLTSKAPVPIISIVHKALVAHRKRTTGDGFIFCGARDGSKPLRIENLYRRVMKPLFKENEIKWKGWHAFRRGVATNLGVLGVEGKTIQAILRHSELATTMDIYRQPVSKEGHAAMRKLERAFSKARAQKKRRLK
jgi:integrase